MKIKFLSLLGISTMFLFSACTPEEQKKLEESNVNAELLVGTWKVTEQTALMNNSLINLLADLDSCELDNLIKLNADNSILQLSGAFKCDSSDLDSEPDGNWALLNDNTQFRVIDASGDTTLGTIVTLSNTTFKFRFNSTDPMFMAEINTILTKQ
jgi:hypothetical protein